MAKLNIPTAVNLTRTGLSVCSSHSPTPLSLVFPEAVVKDLEITDKTQLNTLVKNFVTSKQIRPTKIVLVLSSQVYFEKALNTVPETEKSTQVQSFLDTIPLTSISYKIFRIQNKETLVVINRNFYDAVKQAFTALGFTIVAVVPELALGDSPAPFSADTCRLIFKKLDFLLQNSFLQDDEAGNFQKKEQRFLKTHQTVIVILVLAAIIFAGVMVFFRLNQLKKPTVVRPTRVTPTLIPRPKVPPTATPVSSPSATPKISPKLTP